MSRRNSARTVLMLSTSSWLNTAPIDSPDQLETQCNTDFASLRDRIKNESESDLLRFLHTQMQKSLSSQHTVTRALFHGFLIDEDLSNRCFEAIKSVNSDNYIYLISLLRDIAHNSFHLMKQEAKKKILLLLDELMLVQVQVCLTIVQTLLSYVITCPKSDQFVSGLASLLRKHRSFISSHKTICFIALYAYLRVLAGHTSSTLRSHSEAHSIVFQLISDRGWYDAGRDVARLIRSHTLAAIKTLWNVDSSLLLRACAQPSSRNLLCSRLSPQMESKLCFLFSKVRLGMQHRYLTWFSHQHFVEDASLVVDVIRYICSGFSREISSESVPRWCVLGWLIKSIRKPSLLFQMCEAIFWDWLFFDPRYDSLSSIEPAILLMHYSIPRYADITELCLRSLIKLCDTFEPANMQCNIRSSVEKAFKATLTHHLIPSLSHLQSSPQISSDLRTQLKQFFPAVFITADASGEVDSISLSSSPSSSSSSSLPSSSSSSSAATLSTLDQIMSRLTDKAMMLKASFTALYQALLITTAPAPCVVKPDSSDTLSLLINAVVIIKKFIIELTTNSIDTHLLHDVVLSFAQIIDAEFSVGVFQVSKVLRRLISMFTDESDPFISYLTSIRPSLSYHRLEFLMETSTDPFTDFPLLALQTCRIECPLHYISLLITLCHHSPKVFCANECAFQQLTHALSPNQLDSLCEAVSSGNIPLLLGNNKQCSLIVLSALNWTSFQQLSLWKLIVAQSHSWTSEDILAFCSNVFTSHTLISSDHKNTLNGLTSFLIRVPVSLEKFSTIAACKGNSLQEFRNTTIISCFQQYPEKSVSVLSEIFQGRFHLQLMMMCFLCIKQTHRDKKLASDFVMKLRQNLSLLDFLRLRANKHSRLKKFVSMIESLSASSDDDVDEPARKKAKIVPSNQESSIEKPEEDVSSLSVNDEAMALSSDSDTEDNIAMDAWANFAS